MYLDDKLSNEAERARCGPVAKLTAEKENHAAVAAAQTARSLTMDLIGCIVLVSVVAMAISVTCDMAAHTDAIQNNVRDVLEQTSF